MTDTIIVDNILTITSVEESITVIQAIDVGPQGVKGETGVTGVQGLQGDKGDTGEAGAQGPQGESGVIPAVLVTASSIAATYALTLNAQTFILNALPASVNSTFTLSSPISGQVNETIVHFSTGATLPTIVYSGFSPVWLNGMALSMSINKCYSLVFEHVETSSGVFVIKASWGEY